MAIRTFAAIDVGSFELELGIYEISSKIGVRRIDHVRHVIALGKDTYTTGKISYDLVEEMCEVLGKFKGIMETYKVADYRAYATSAMREAKNNQIILDQIRVRTGITVRIISNSEQRFISYKAIANKADAFDKIIQKAAAIVDVGFGSMQISLFDKSSLVSTQNLPIGVLRLKEMIARVPTDDNTRYALLEEIVDNELFTFRKMYLKDRETKQLIGIGESILYLSRQIKSSEKENVQNISSDRITAEEFDAFYHRLIGMSLRQVEENFGVGAEYANLLTLGAIIYHRILELTGAEMFWIPGIRLVDGIAADYAESTKLVKFSHDFSDDIIVTSRNIAKRYKCHMAHCQCVESYVLQIFDTIKRYHGLDNRDRLLLQIAANLHACGKFISMKNPGACAYDIIMSTEIIGLSHAERELIANVVRLNLQEFDYNTATMKIAKLTAILRLANAMDRGHAQKLKDCKMSYRDDELIMTTSYEGDITLERMAYEGKVEFFKEIFGIEPVLKQKKRYK